MYDTKCRDLAEYFLEDEEHVPEEVDSLAQEIQDSIERWFEPRQSRPKEVTP
jgi:predicted component of type VI protein secretion system